MGKTPRNTMFDDEKFEVKTLRDLLKVIEQDTDE
jgi:hypothetical protein